MLISLIRRDAEVRDLVSLGVVELVDASATSTVQGLDEEIESTCARLVEQWAGRTPSEIPPLEPARALYRAFGVDPTKTRPSSEALLRRILRGKGFPRVTPLVDLANLWAVVSALSVGLYDADAIEGDGIVVRRGAAGESYPGIRKAEIRLEGRLVLADAAGPFGNPSADSARTAVSGTTRWCLFVMFAPSSFDVAALDRWAGWLRERAAAYFGGSSVSGVLP